MSLSPVVSVVLATRDRPSLLRGAIAAVLTQTFHELELIVVDDGSGPETAGVVADAEVDPRVRGIRHAKPRGAAAARNAGAALARGRHLLFEDDDCRGMPGRVEALVEALASDREAAYAYSLARHVEPSGQIVIKGDEGPWTIGTPAALIRTEVFRETGGFDERLPRLVDFDLWTRILARWRAVAVPEVLFESVRSDSGLSGSTNALEAAARRLLVKYRPGDLPAEHHAAMHRRVGGALLLEGLWGAGLRHFRASIRSCPWCPRSWLGLAAGLTGPFLYRGILSRIP